MLSPGDLLDAAADALADPVVVVGPEQVAVALEHLFGQRAHLVRPEARIDAQVFERAVEPVDVLLHLEQPVAEACGSCRSSRRHRPSSKSRNGMRTSRSGMNSPLNQATRSFAHSAIGPLPENRQLTLPHDPEKWIPVFGLDHAPAGGLRDRASPMVANPHNPCYKPREFSEAIPCARAR